MTGASGVADFCRLTAASRLTRTASRTRLSRPKCGLGRRAPICGAFRHLSDDYLNRESGHEYLIELLVYGLVAAIAAWPLVSMLMLLVETARG